MSLRLSLAGDRPESIRLMLEKLEDTTSRPLPRRILSKGARKLEHFLWSFTPVAKKTSVWKGQVIKPGALRRSIKKTWGHNIITITIGDETTPHLFAVEGGVRFHMITPKTAPFLKFLKEGKWIRKKSVRHFGYPGRRFVEKAWERFITETSEELMKDVEGELDNITGRYI